MKRKIFLADDSITIQKVVELTFPEADYEVTCVGTGTQAAERIKSLVPDIAMLDVVMPEKSGYEVCALVKQDPALKWMPVLLISGAFEPFDEKRAAEAGFDGRLTKPFESRALVAKVEELIAAHPHPERVFEPTRPAPPPPTAAQTVRISSGETHHPSHPPAPARPSVPPPAARSAAPAAGSARPVSSGGTPTPSVQIPQELLERAVREALAGISEKVVREIAWEVIPDLAESIIQRRIRELEEEAAPAD